MCSSDLQELTARLIRLGDTRAASFSDSSLMAEQYWGLFQYAAGLDNQSNILVGVHADGWAGPRPKLQIAPSTQTRTLDLEITLPRGAPTDKVTLQIQQDQERRAEFTVVRGHNGSVSIALPSAGGQFDISMSPSFVPALTGGGNDRRELSAKLVKCEIVHADGQHEVLFPESCAT